MARYHRVALQPLFWPERPFLPGTLTLAVQGLRQLRVPWSRRRLLASWAVTVAGLWGVSLTYLHLAPRIYTCQWSMILPNSGKGVNLNLDNLGSVSAATSAAFGSEIDPRANYQTIAQSYTVLSAAAKRLNMNVEAFGEPRIKLIDQTSVMEFEVKGNSNEMAQAKSIALYEAFQQRLQQLRNEEINKRQEGFRAAIKTARRSLEESQQQVRDFKTKSGISSTEQLRDVGSNLEQLRRQQSELQTQLGRSQSRLRELSRSLNLTPSQAADAFVMQADPLFQQLLRQYSEARAALTVALSKWGDRHPQVITAEAKQQAALKSLQQRAQTLLGHPTNSELISRLLLTPEGGNRAALFQDLITTQAEVSGLRGQLRSLAQEVDRQQLRLQQLTQKGATLENLQRNLQISQAVFSSTLGQVDVGRTDVFAAYPLVQMLMEPGLPSEASSPKPKLVLLGTCAGTILTSAAFASLRWRRRQQECNG